jgi:hypothetical protein
VWGNSLSFLATGRPLPMPLNFCAKHRNYAFPANLKDIEALLNSKFQISNIPMPFCAKHRKDGEIMYFQQTRKRLRPLFLPDLLHHGHRWIIESLFAYNFAIIESSLRIDSAGMHRIMARTWQFDINLRMPKPSQQEKVIDIHYRLPIYGLHRRCNTGNLRFSMIF